MDSDDELQVLYDANNSVNGTALDNNPENAPADNLRIVPATSYQHVKDDFFLIQWIHRTATANVYANRTSNHPNNTRNNMMLETCNYPKEMEGVEDDGGSTGSTDAIQGDDDAKHVLLCIEDIFQSIECCNDSKDLSQSVTGNSDSNDILQVTEGSDEFKGSLQNVPDNQNVGGELQVTGGSDEFKDSLQNVPNNNNLEGELQVTEGNNEFKDRLQNDPDNNNVEGELQVTEGNAEFKDSVQSVPDNNNLEGELQVTAGSDEFKDSLQNAPNNKEVEGDLQVAEGSDRFKDSFQNVPDNYNLDGDLQVCKYKVESKDLPQLNTDYYNSKSILQNVENTDNSNDLLRNNSDVGQIIEEILEKIEYFDLTESTQSPIDYSISENTLPSIENQDNSDVGQIIEEILEKIEYFDLTESTQSPIDYSISENTLPSIENQDNSDVGQIIEEILEKIEYFDLTESTSPIDYSISENTLLSIENQDNLNGIYQYQVIEHCNIQYYFPIIENIDDFTNRFPHIQSNIELRNNLLSIERNTDSNNFLQNIQYDTDLSECMQVIESLLCNIESNSDPSDTVKSVIEDIIQYIENSESNTVFQCFENIEDSSGLVQMFFGAGFQTNEIECNSFGFSDCYTLNVNDYDAMEADAVVEENFQWDLVENKASSVVENAEWGENDIVEYAELNNEDSIVHGTELGSNNVILDSKWVSGGGIIHNLIWDYENGEWCRIKSEPVDESEYDESESFVISEHDSQNQTNICTEHDSESQTLVNGKVYNENEIHAHIDVEDCIDGETAVDTKTENESDIVLEAEHSDNFVHMKHDDNDENFVHMRHDDNDEIIECDNDDCTIEKVIKLNKRNSETNHAVKDIECINEDGVFQVPDDDSEHEYVLDDSECSSDDNIEIMECSRNDGEELLSMSGTKRKNEDLYKSIKKIRLDPGEANKKLASLIKERLDKCAVAPGIVYEKYEPFCSDLLDIFIDLEIKKIHGGVSKETIHKLRRSWELLGCALSENKATFADCQSFVNSRQTINGASPTNDVVHLPSTSQNRSPEDNNVQVLDMCSKNPDTQLKFPPLGPLSRPDLILGTKVYAMKFSLADVWLPGKITAKVIKNGVTKYEIHFDNNKEPKVILTKKQIAYSTPSPVRIPFGSRIIGLYTPDDNPNNSAWYAGFIGEPLKSTNKYRYLIFFDDGVAQYVNHKNVRILGEDSVRTFEDVSPGVREFTRKYIEEFPERPMLRLQRSQAIKAERGGKWIVATVLAVDASLVKLQFSDDSSEWIYRGSRRLFAINKALQNAELVRQNRPAGRSRRNISRAPAGDDPYVEYTGVFSPIVVHSVSDDSDEDDDDDAEVIIPDSDTSVVRRNVAKKSTAKPHKPNMNSRKKQQPIPHKEGLIEKIPEIPHTPVTYSPHMCSMSCLQMNDISQFTGKNPLSIPMLMGFERHIVRTRRRGNSNVIVWYRAPCGRMMRNLSDVNYYLFTTDSQLTIDLFCDDPSIIIYRYFRTTVEETLWSTSDISEGREAIPIPCVNCFTNEKPPYVEYATTPYPGKDVKLNLEKEFLCGCDCTDNCQDRLKCKCQRLTFQAYSKDGSVTDIGYHHRRLMESVITGVYECNSQCSCNSKCPNRVVQNKLSIRLQLFRTYLKGWGIRCIDDVAKGTFLCIYAGQLLTDAEADAEGKVIGDEYMAELDHIDVVERMKEGYEESVIVPIDIDVEENASDVNDSDVDLASSKASTSSESPLESCHESDSDFEEPSFKSDLGSSNYSTRSNKRSSQKKKSFFDDIEDSENKDPIEPSKVDLPDLKESSNSDFMSLGFRLRPLSPETNERAVTFANRSNIGSKHTSAKRLVPPTNVSAFPQTEDNPPKKFKSIRAFFGEEDCYIMDAKTKGNIGRYLNHSCEPNCFVQSVFTETQDLRFPTVAFFAKENLAAGTELTWDYNYEVGSVPDKSLVCHCATQRCRGRLL